MLRPIAKATPPTATTTATPSRTFSQRPLDEARLAGVGAVAGRAGSRSGGLGSTTDRVGSKESAGGTVGAGASGGMDVVGSSDTGISSVIRSAGR